MTNYGLRVNLVKRTAHALTPIVTIPPSIHTHLHILTTQCRNNIQSPNFAVPNVAVLPWQSSCPGLHPYQPSMSMTALHRRPQLLPLSSALHLCHHLHHLLALLAPLVSLPSHHHQPLLAHPHWNCHRWPPQARKTMVLTSQTRRIPLGHRPPSPSSLTSLAQHQ